MRHTDELLKFALENGMINLGTIQEKMEMNERKKYLNMHPYSVWEGKDGKWYTYLPDDEKGRKLKKLATKKSIEDFIVIVFVSLFHYRFIGFFIAFKTFFFITKQLIFPTSGA